MKVEFEDSKIEEMIEMIASSEGSTNADVAEYRGLLELARAARIVKEQDRDYSPEC